MHDPKNPLYKHQHLEKNAFRFTVWITTWHSDVPTSSQRSST